jgi:RNA polymerase sigma-70 factor, ECF subfamily
MPPWPQWYRGRDAIRAFFASMWPPGGPGASHPRLVPTAANGQPAFALYRPVDERGTLEARGIEVLTIRQGAIAAIINFRDPRLLAWFDLPATRPGA